MRTQVKQTDRTILVRAVADDGTVVGVLKASLEHADYMDEYRHDTWNEACEYCLGGDRERADELMTDLDKAMRCYDAIYEVRDKDPGPPWIGDVFALETVELRGRDRRENLDAALKMYRAAAVAAGRRQHPFAAEACSYYMSGYGEIPKGISAWVWKQPEFRSGMKIKGPVAYHPAQLALGAGRAANPWVGRPPPDFIQDDMCKQGQPGGPIAHWRIPGCDQPQHRGQASDSVEAGGVARVANLRRRLVR